MTRQKILVTGANGQLGMELRTAAAGNPLFEFVFLTRNELPFEEPGAIDRVFETHTPAWCINCAAYTAVDKAEADKELAYRINAVAVGELAAACKKKNSRLVHISTDYVFDGNSATPLKEQDPTGPVNVYGASKLLGEQLAMMSQQDTVILRTSWVYSEFGNNFVRTMIRLMKTRESIGVVDDQVGSPTYAADLAAVILHILRAPVFQPGIFHYSNEGEVSWYGFARAIAAAIGSSCRVEPLTTAQYPTPARRPHYSLLDKTLIRETYGISIPAWQDSLAICLKRPGLV